MTTLLHAKSTAAPVARALGAGALDGKCYLEGLRDGREVWVNGERIGDISTHPLFRGLCAEMARLYDLQHAAATRDVMTFVSDNGVRVSCSYFEPRTSVDLVRRRHNAEVWARESFGMMGRYPDFCAAMTIGFKAAGDELAKVDPAFARNAAWYHQFASENDLCLGHGLHDPNMDKSLRPQQDPDRCLRIVKEKDDGIIVRGARFVTLAPVTHEILVAPTYVLNEHEADHALWFAIGSNAPGLRIICREPFSARSRFDHPASARFDEQDALVVFDDVLVPWERVFLTRQSLLANQLFRSRVMAWASHAAVVQLLARLELMIGVGHLMAKTGGISARPNVQQLLGELVTYKLIFEALMRVSEVECVPTPSGLVAPASMLHQRAFIALISERIVNILEQIGTSALIFLPNEKDFEVPELRPLLDLYYRGKDVTAYDRTKLCKLAWELTGDSFGGRQQLYERLHSGDPNTILAGTYLRYDPTRAVEMVNKLLDTNL